MEMLNADVDSTSFWTLDWEIKKAENSLIYSSLGSSENNSNITGNSILNSNEDTKSAKKTKGKKGKKSVIAQEVKNSTCLPINNEKNFIVKNRGGEIKSKCEEHRSPTVYCHCQNKDESTEFMVCCDNCEVWFHSKCVGLSDIALKQLKKWYCSYCTDYINNKNNFLLAESESNDDNNNKDLINQILNENWRHAIVFPHIKYKLNDLIFMATLFQNKVASLESATCNNKLAENTLESGKQIPLNLFYFYFKLHAKIAKYNQYNIDSEEEILVSKICNELNFKSPFSENDQMYLIYL